MPKASKQPKKQKQPTWKYAVRDDHKVVIPAGAPRMQCHSCQLFEKDRSRKGTIANLPPVEKRLCPTHSNPCGLETCDRAAKNDGYCSTHHPDWGCSKAGCASNATKKLGTCNQHKPK